jgi:4-hydroxy-3-polyprenylbenzoate decarboxylase
VYQTLEDCLLDLEKNGHLLRIKEEVDPYLEMASIHLRIFEQGGPAILFEKVKGTSYRAASNIFGTLERSEFIFRKTIPHVHTLIQAKNNPAALLKNPLIGLQAGWRAVKALPRKQSGLQGFEKINISDLPLIQHWPMDGGAFVTLPQVYSEDIEYPGIMNANMGMYRIQLSGNEYVMNEEIGLHYQLHRGIGVHQTKANAKGIPLKVSCFVGGPPAHTVAAVMPLPEGISEATFAGVLGGKRFRYGYIDGYALSYDADFVITGYVDPGSNKPEGPFGDHLGYYSLQHEFPLMKVTSVYARKNAIWPFTVVGRPPQEDTSFGALIHKMTGSAIQKEIPGLISVHAVDAAGVHPLLFAIGQERYTPFHPAQQPAELLTIANHALGTGQLSLAKYLYITSQGSPDIHDIEAYHSYIWERLHTDRDLHFYTNTSIDTLDYSGAGLNQGSKVVLAAHGAVIRTLCTEVPKCFTENRIIKNVKLALPGTIAIEVQPYTTPESAIEEMAKLEESLLNIMENDSPLIIVCDDADFVSARVNNYLWVTYTRSNPSHDIYGIGTEIKNKHWGASKAIVIDARVKPHHAPVLELDPKIEMRVDALLSKYHI